MLKIRTERVGQTIFFRIRGNIVVGPELEFFRKKVAAQTDASSVVLDLARVSRIDAAGLGVMLQLREQIQTNGKEFRLTNVTRLIKQVLEITCLDSVFDTSSTEELIRGSNAVDPLAPKDPKVSGEFQLIDTASTCGGTS
jgi:anti-anti-sigma factor